MYGPIYYPTRDTFPFADCKRRVAKASTSSKTGLSRLLRSSRRKNRLQRFDFGRGQSMTCIIGVNGYMICRIRRFGAVEKGVVS